MLAARAPFYARGATEPVGTPPAGLRQQIAASQFGGLLLVYALLLPIIHLAFYSFDLLQGAGLRQRRVVVLASMLILGTLALLQQTLRKKHTLRLQAELEAATERLHQSERLEAIGRLAGGVAHDFNNLLTAVIGYSDLLEEELAGQDRLHAYAQEIRRAADRAATLTRQLLAYGRRQMLVPELVDLGDVVSNVLPLLGSLLGEAVRLEVQRKPDLAKVRVDASQIEQVIVNLALNARDAMPGGGTLTIETANLPRGQKAADAVTDGGPDRCVQLVVRDTGHGMDAATRKRIFEPFFTTKEVGKGTGLGLSTVYGIVSQSGGTTDVESQLGKGTTFRICFPEARVDG